MVPRKGGPAPIRAEVTISGPAEEVLRALSNVRGCERRVKLTVETPARFYSRFPDDHMLPEIKSGQIRAALEKLEMMSSQGVITSETDERLDRFIKEFGRFTGQ